MHKPLKYELVRQGTPLLKEAYIMAESNSVVAIQINMRSKRCRVYAWGSDENSMPNILIDSTEESLHLHPENKGDTIIEFPQYKGWEVWSATIAKYSLYLCLVHRDAIYNPD